MSKLLKAINDNRNELSNIEIINQISAVLDKNRELSVQEVVYRALSLPMTKSSVKVKYLSTIHPNYRDGLLKSNLESLDEDESIFYKSLHQYYECRSLECINDVQYEDYEKEEGYWENLSLAEFWSSYDITYSSRTGENPNNYLIPLQNNLGFIRRRKERCILRYHLNTANDEDLKRGLLILFSPFTDEMKDIHAKDVHKLFEEKKESIEVVRNIFESHRVMTDIVNRIQQENENMRDEGSDTEEESNFVDEETTTAEELIDFERYAKNEAKKSLRKYKDLIALPKVESIRQTINQLNEQQRQIFDDICERVYASEGGDDSSFYTYIAGDAGTGKSFVCRAIIEAIKYLKTSSGDELRMPKCIVMAPTANASYIINGKTIESALQMLPKNPKSFVKSNREKVSNLTFLYQDVTIAFLDEISMVGSSKFTKINFQLQDIMGNSSFMGGLSFIAAGDFRQLPPIRDGYVYQGNSLDGRPKIAPSHWDEHFRIFYLTEKMRSQKDPEFSSLCDRIGNGTYTEEDIKFLQSRIIDTESENHNDNFKSGHISIIVTTNRVRQEINDHKLDTLLPSNDEFFSLADDHCTNLEDPPPVPDKMSLTQTGGLEKLLTLKEDAPIVITCNHQKAKYKEDGIVNGARGFIDSLQISKTDTRKIEVIWVVFKDSNVGKLVRFDYRKLKNDHRPRNVLAVPILRQKRTFSINNGEVRYQRSQFPLTLAYAITSYKCQGDSLHEVIIDFSTAPGEKKSVPQAGSFYVAITRVSERKDIYLKSFDKSYITFNKKVEDKIKSMRSTKAYECKKIYLNQRVFKKDYEVKLGYWNIRGIMESDHREYLDSDKNLLNLDFLVIAETWLSKETKDHVLMKKLTNWKLIMRIDALDGFKHMGLLVLSSLETKRYDHIWSLEGCEGRKTNKGDNKLLYQGLRFCIKELYKKVIFLYVRETPSNKDTLLIAEVCKDFDVIIGDLNLNPAISDEKKKLDIICGKSRYMALREQTTTNHNQLDHVFIDHEMKSCSYATSFLNFCSDHKAISLRVTTSDNTFHEDFLAKIHFDSDFHKQKKKWKTSAIEENAFQTSSKHRSSKSVSTLTQESDIMNEAKARAASLGFIFSRSQPYTEGDGNCLIHALLDQLRNSNHPITLNINSVQDFRVYVCSRLMEQIESSSICWPESISPQTWKDQMMCDGNWCDDIFIQVAANLLDVNVILIPISSASAHHDGMYIDVRSVHGGHSTPPFTLLYFEEWRTAGHYQSLEPDPMVEDNIVLSHFRSRLYD